jgi:hypothetical protein
MERQENMEGNSFVMDTIVDGRFFPWNRTHKVVNDACDRVFNYCSKSPFIEQGLGLQ